MKELIFIKSSNYTNVRVFSKQHFIERCFYANRRTHVAFMGEWSIPLCSMSLEMFSQIFSEYEIGIMQKNGNLNYYPNGRKHFTDIATKYPIFSAKIYKKYGVAKNNWD